MLTWISPIPFWNKQRNLQRKHLPGSGTWFLSSSDFQRWINGEVKVLNCTGIPGSGKTILSSMVVDHLEEHKYNVPRAYVFCDYLSRADRAIENILPSILRQVVQMRGECSADLKELFKTRNMMDEPLSLKERECSLKSLWAKRSVVLCWWMGWMNWMMKIICWSGC